MKTLDLSSFDETKFDEAYDILALNGFWEKFSKEIAMRLDKEYVRQAFAKAAKYDECFNPYTVTAHEKRKTIQSFCQWFLDKIESNYGMTAAEMIQILQEYAK